MAVNQTFVRYHFGFTHMKFRTDLILSFTLTVLLDPSIHYGKKRDITQKPASSEESAMAKKDEIIKNLSEEDERAEEDDIKSGQNRPFTFKIHLLVVNINPAHLPNSILIPDVILVCGEVIWKVKFR